MYSSLVYHPPTSNQLLYQIPTVILLKHLLHPHLNNIEREREREIQPGNEPGNS